MTLNIRIRDKRIKREIGGTDLSLGESIISIYKFREARTKGDDEQGNEKLASFFFLPKRTGKSKFREIIKNYIYNTSAKKAVRDDAHH